MLKSLWGKIFTNRNPINSTATQKRLLFAALVIFGGFYFGMKHLKDKAKNVKVADAKGLHRKSATSKGIFTTPVEQIDPILPVISGIEGKGIETSDEVAKLKIEQQNNKKRIEELTKALQSVGNSLSGHSKHRLGQLLGSSVKSKSLNDKSFSGKDLNIVNNNDNLPAVTSTKGSSPANDEEYIVEDRYEPDISEISIAGNFSNNNAKSYVAQGTYAQALVTGGAAVPTANSAQENPIPLILRILDDGKQPNGGESNLKDAVVTASCYGTLGSRRAQCRIRSISMINPQGIRIQKNVKGWIFSEDGMLGFKGEVYSDQGKILQNAIIAGTLSGIAEVAKNSSTKSVYPISPISGQSNALSTASSVQAGVAQGIGNTLDKVADFNIKQAEQISPQIMILAGRKVTIHFDSAFDLEEEPDMVRGFNDDDSLTQTKESNKSTNKPRSF